MGLIECLMFRQDLQNSELRTFWITGELNYELLQVLVLVDLLTVMVYCLATGKDALKANWSAI